MERVCYVVGAGDFFGFCRAPVKKDYVIAADGGYAYLQRLGISPDLVLGDFDSLAKKPQNRNVIELPREKDDTDMLYALRLGIEKGFTCFYLYGGMGGRFEHTLANLQALAFLASRGARGFLFGQNEVTTIFQNGSLSFGAEAEGYFSLFSYGRTCTGVCIQGMKYELEDAQIENTYPIGVSNEFIGRPSRISIASGTAIAVFAQKNMNSLKTT